MAGNGPHSRHKRDIRPEKPAQTEFPPLGTAGPPDGSAGGAPPPADAARPHPGDAGGDGWGPLRLVGAANSAGQTVLRRQSAFRGQSGRCVGMLPRRHRPPRTVRSSGGPFNRRQLMKIGSRPGCLTSFSWLSSRWSMAFTKAGTCSWLKTVEARSAVFSRRIIRSR